MAQFNRFLGTPEDLAGFAFKQRHGKVNWRQIEEMDLDRVLQTGDPEPVQAALENLTFALLDREDLEKLSDAKAVQLFKLMQLGLEYLLNVQNSLYAQTQTTQVKYSEMHAQAQALETRVRSQEEDAASLKRELESKRKSLVSYEYMLRQPSTAAAATTALNRANAVKCPTCSKHFMSREFLDKHEIRRHAARKPDPVVEKKQDIAFGAMLDTMKTIISQNIAVVTEAHAREMEALKAAFDRKLQEIESTRQSLEARKTELDAAPNSAVNELVLRELISTQNEMRRVLEDRDKLILEQMRMAEEQRKRQEELDRSRQAALEQRLTQLVEAQLQAHLPPEEPPLPAIPESPKPAVRVEPVPAPQPPPVILPTNLVFTIERKPIGSRAGDIEDDEPTPEEVAEELLTVKSGKEEPFKDKDEMMLDELRGSGKPGKEAISSGNIEEIGENSGSFRSIIQTSISQKPKMNIEEEIAAAVTLLGLQSEPELEFLARAYVVRSQREQRSSGPFGSRLQDVLKKTASTLRTQKSLSTWTKFLREAEDERVPGLSTNLLSLFKHSPNDVIRTREKSKNIELLRRSPRVSSPSDYAASTALRSFVEHFLLQKLRESRDEPGREEPRKEERKEEVRRQEPKEEVIRPRREEKKEEVPRQEPKREEKKEVPKQEPRREEVKPEIPHEETKKPVSALAKAFVQKVLKPKQGLMDKLDYEVLLDREIQLAESQRFAEGAVLAFGQIDANDIEEMDAECRKSRVIRIQNQAITAKVINSMFKPQLPRD